MTPKEIIGYVLTLLVAPLAGWLCDHFGLKDLAPVLVGGLAGLGGRLLHTSDPPTKPTGAIPAMVIPVLLAGSMLSGCAFLQRPATQTVVRCTGAVVSACKDEALPTISACLAAPANPTPCLLALLSAGTCASREAIACRARDVTEGAGPSMQALLSPFPSDAARAEQLRKESNAQAFFNDVGLVPVAP